MKIAVPTSGKHVEENFAHARTFTIFTLDEDLRIVETEIFFPPSGCSCHSAVDAAMRAKGVGTILVGRIGQGSADALSAHGIRIVRGCAGAPLDALEDWLRVENEGQSTEHNHQE
jgi:predicted Fe-Mo cluster-binding NifX family protein